MPTAKGSRKRKIEAKAIVDAMQEAEEAQKPAKKSKPRAPKQYVPQIRSGSYAILLALLDATDTGEKGLTRHEICARGQVYCDTSLTNAEHGKFYSSWASVKTLTGKNLVYQNGTKYYLTPEGIEIAKSIKTAAKGTDRAIRGDPNADDDRDEEEEEEEEVEDWEQTFSSSRNKSAILPEYSRTKQTSGSQKSTSTAAVSRKTPSSSSSAKSFTGSQALNDWDFNIDIAGPDTFETKSSNSQTTSWKSSTGSRPGVGDLHQHVNLISDSEDETHTSSSRTSARPEPTMATTNTTASTERTNGLQRTRTVVLPKIDTLQRQQPDRSQRTESSSSLTASSSQSAPKKPISTHNPFPRLRSSSSSALWGGENSPTAAEIARLARFQPIVYPPGTFDICLVLDVREVRTQKDRDYIEDEIGKAGIKVLRKPLDIGDVIWMACPNDPQFDGPTEIVLDYVLERKRMDDLVSSIKDGRYTEQKFRLRRSGLGHVIYLVETYKQNEEYDVGAEALRTAMASSQVHEGFFLKRTNNTDQTINYLISVTNMLKKIHSKNTLYAIPKSAVNRNNYLDLQDYLHEQHPSRNYLTTYEGFCVLNGKSDSQVVSDVFIKMLMTIRGISEEKAVEIAKTYGTPRALFSELDDSTEATDQAGRRKLVARACPGVNRKKIGPSLSTKIADIWYLDEYPPSQT
ncbi:Crossover junction endonuclease mus81 [Gryganskiella cystojenkinii]|nr:Crossover junction endonuclease mus81 [Gryganskiella cystojenkinii]